MSNRKLWTQKDGKKIRIKDMTNLHLTNTISFLLRYAGNEKNYSLCNFPSFNGEMAQYYAEQEWDVLNEMDDWEFAEMEYPIFKDLVDEAFMRNLDISELGE